MRFLVDAQLPAALAALLSAAGHDSVHTTELPDGNRTSDAELARRFGHAYVFAVGRCAPVRRGPESAVGEEGVGAAGRETVQEHEGLGLPYVDLRPVRAQSGEDLASGLLGADLAGAATSGHGCVD